MVKNARWIFALLLALAVVSCSKPPPQPAPSTIVLLVRHAEKASDAEDSPLTEAGTQRSQALVRVADAAGVSAIYTTQFKRNRDTAQPLSERLKIAVTESPIKDIQNPGDYAKTLAREITEKHAGQTVLVVGHSNTIPLMLEALTGQPAPADHAEYSDLFIVTVPPSGPARLIKAQYGTGGPK
ncbi:MAG TPA: phosphoglycerate mutase family protein [Pyrinomonadaceae bacterium]|nr:phosphoglycerate mutase family protein [Pyrinomonadaceae bacterium]